MARKKTKTKGKLYKSRKASRGMKRIDEVDVYVGEQIRKLRLLRGLSQTELAKGIGVKFQQLQKYEAGGNRVSAGRLVKLAKNLDVSPSHILGKYEGGNELSDSWNDRRAIRMFQVYKRLPREIQMNLYKLFMEMEALSLGKRKV